MWNKLLQFYGNFSVMEVPVSTQKTIFRYE
jgi:hypothetical protein